MKTRGQNKYLGKILFINNGGNFVYIVRRNKIEILCTTSITRTLEHINVKKMFASVSIGAVARRTVRAGSDTSQCWD